MSLADEIGALRDRTLNDLNSAHDYFADTKTAWRIVRNFAKAGRTFSIRNTITGTKTSEADLVGKAQSYIARELMGATFQLFISIFENYFCEFLQLWLIAYPQSLKDKKIDFDESSERQR